MPGRNMPDVLNMSGFLSKTGCLILLFFDTLIFVFLKGLISSHDVSGLKDGLTFGLIIGLICGLNFGLTFTLIVWLARFFNSGT